MLTFDAELFFGYHHERRTLADHGSEPCCVHHGALLRSVTRSELFARIPTSLVHAYKSFHAIKVRHAARSLLDGHAGHERVSRLALRTGTRDSVVLSRTGSTFAAGVVVRAQIFALSVEAHVIGRAVAIGFAAHDQAARVWISRTTIRARAAGLVVLWCAFSEQAALVVHEARVHAVAAVAC